MNSRPVVVKTEPLEAVRSPITFEVLEKFLKDRVQITRPNNCKENCIWLAIDCVEAIDYWLSKKESTAKVVRTDDPLKETLCNRITTVTNPVYDQQGKLLGYPKTTTFSIAQQVPGTGNSLLPPQEKIIVSENVSGEEVRKLMIYVEEEAHPRTIFAFDKLNDALKDEAKKRGGAAFGILRLERRITNAKAHEIAFYSTEQGVRYVDLQNYNGGEKTELDQIVFENLEKAYSFPKSPTDVQSEFISSCGYIVYGSAHSFSPFMKLNEPSMESFPVEEKKTTAKRKSVENNSLQNKKRKTTQDFAEILKDLREEIKTINPDLFSDQLKRKTIWQRLFDEFHKSDDSKKVELACELSKALVETYKWCVNEKFQLDNKQLKASPLWMLIRKNYKVYGNKDDQRSVQPIIKLVAYFLQELKANIQQNIAETIAGSWKKTTIKEMIELVTKRCISSELKQELKKLFATSQLSETKQSSSLGKPENLLITKKISPIEAAEKALEKKLEHLTTLQNILEELKKEASTITRDDKDKIRRQAFWQVLINSFHASTDPNRVELVSNLVNDIIKNLNINEVFSGQQKDAICPLWMIIRKKRTNKDTREVTPIINLVKFFLDHNADIDIKLKLRILKKGENSLDSVYRTVTLSIREFISTVTEYQISTALKNSLLELLKNYPKVVLSKTSQALNPNRLFSLPAQLTQSKLPNNSNPCSSFSHISKTF